MWKYDSMIKVTKYVVDKHKIDEKTFFPGSKDSILLITNYAFFLKT